jgi:site-specific DNA-cytosine methylase
VGAPHERERLILVAHLDGDGQLQPRGGIEEERRRLGHGSGQGERGQWAPEPDVVRVADGFRRRLDSARRGALGNAAVSQVLERAGRLVLQLDGGGLA